MFPHLDKHDQTHDDGVTLSPSWQKLRQPFGSKTTALALNSTPPMHKKNHCICYNYKNYKHKKNHWYSLLGQPASSGGSHHHTITYTTPIVI